MKYLIKNGTIIDPVNKIEEVSDIIVSDGKIENVGKDLNDAAAQIIDAAGKIVAPGLVDMHTHLREPGREDEETVNSGTRAAIKGGYTAVACMPNTEPPIDDIEMAKILRRIISSDAMTNVLIVGAITKGRLGKALADLGGMQKEGVAAISDDGSSIEDKELMLKALKEAKRESLLTIVHCEDQAISQKGVINQGFIATKMGLRGIPRQAEYERVRRDIELAEKALSKLHIAHVSCKESVDIIRKAKKAGIEVTAETAPHYFSLTEECCTTYDTNTKMNPPLRTKDDVEAIKRGLADGTLDAIATDHAPHMDSEKDVEFDFAPFGIIGLETALSLSIMELVDRGVLSWAELIKKMSTNPSKILGLKRDGLRKGSVADIAIIDPAYEYTYTKDSIESKSKNSPFINWKLKGKAWCVFVAGKCLMKDCAIMADDKGMTR